MNFRKTLFLAVIFLALGWGILFAPKAEAADEFTITADRTIVEGNYTVQICTDSSITFTVTKSGSPVIGASVSINGANKGPTNSCQALTDNSGKCTTGLLNKIVQGDIAVTATKASENGALTLVAVARQLPKETTCNNQCNDDMDSAGADCADQDDCTAGTICGKNEEGLDKRCTDNGHCEVPTGTLEITSFSPATAIVGIPVVFTFTANFSNARFDFTRNPANIIPISECQAINSDTCTTESVTPAAAGTISVIAHINGYMDSLPPKVITVNAADALAVTTGGVDTITVGEETTITFTVKDNANNSIDGATVSISGAGITANCSTDANGQCTKPIKASSSGLVTITASKNGMTQGSITIEAVLSGTGTGTGTTGSFGLPTATLKTIINRLIAWLLGIAAGLAILFIIIGGLYYVTAAGDESKVETGKKIVTYAVIGLFIAGVSYSILKVISGIIKGI